MSSTSRAHPKGHAVLHDFCVVFPASAFFLGIGSLGLLLGKSRTAAATAAVGAVQLILGRQSLQCWRAGTGSQVYTLAEATSSILVAYLTYQAWQQGMSKIFAAPTFMVSSLVALFLIYNVLAGGNPPPKKGV